MQLREKLVDDNKEILENIDEKIQEEHQLSDLETLRLLDRISHRSISDISKLYKGNRKLRRNSARALKERKK